MERLGFGLEPFPVTAISYVPQLDIILAAKGPNVFAVEITDLDKPNPWQRPECQVFATQSIHGLEVHGVQKNGNITVLAWGGSFIRFISLKRSPLADREIPSSQNPAKSSLIYRLSPSFQVSSWIVHAIFIRNESSDEVPRVCFLTSQNVLGLLSLRTTKGVDLKYGLSEVTTPDYDTLSSARETVLYSGYIIQDQDGLVVASGTMFGQVLVWRCALNVEPIKDSPSSVLLADFHEHEGSVFGVCIKRVELADKKGCQFYVASCSDDRTVRIYRVSDKSSIKYFDRPTAYTGFSEASSAASTQKSSTSGVSKTSAHTSRIWQVRWLENAVSSPLLMSFGEDMRAQLWHVTCLTDQDEMAKGSNVISLERIKSYGNHFGKNIWSAAIAPPSLAYAYTRIFTGGADGRVISFKVGAHTNLGGPTARRIEISQETIANNEEDTRRLFLSLEGKWTMDRNLESKRPEYPSGKFVGAATITRRPVSDDAFDDEMLYKEDGHFSTTTGLSFPARRNYVYRYQKSTKTITAWFVKPDASETVDYLFHQVVFSGEKTMRNTQDTKDLQVATGYHLCVRDHYNATYTFDHSSKVSREWVLSYYVTGPEKDYTATCRFSRVSDSHEINGSEDSSKRVLREEMIVTDTLRSFCWLGERRCLASTEKNDIVIFDTAITSNDTSSEKLWRELEVYPLSKVRPLHLVNITSLQSYSLIGRLEFFGAAIAYGQGCVHLIGLHEHFDLNRQFQSKQLWKLDSKVSFIHTQREEMPSGRWFFLLFQSLKQNLLHWTFFPEKEARIALEDDKIPENMQLQSLVVPPGFIATSAHYCREAGALLVGSRKGSVCVWTSRAESNSFVPVNGQYDHIPNVHGRDAVTSITHLPNDDVGEITDYGESRGNMSNLQRETKGWKDASPAHFFTVGRDGRIKQHRLIQKPGENCRFETSSDLQLPFGPSVEGVQVVQNPLRIVSWGFQGTSFMCWDVTNQQEVMKVRSGNAHRNWDFMLEKDLIGLGGAFIWNQAGSSHIHIQEEPQHTVVSQGGHGREIKCMDHDTFRVSGDEERRRIIATGAEDTDIRLFDFSDTNGEECGRRLRPNFRCLATLYGHTTGLTHLQFAGDGNMLFSCGGKEELFAWKIGLMKTSDSTIPQVQLYGNCPGVTEANYLRITGFDLIKGPFDRQERSSSPNDQENHYFIIPVIYSDSSVRIWVYRPPSRSFNLIGEARYSTNCLTCVKHIRLCGASLLAVTSSNGYLVLYSLTLTHAGDNTSSAAPPPQAATCEALIRHRIHQSSIKSLDFRNISSREALIVTGGDDNALGFTRVTSNNHQEATAAIDGPRVYAVATVLVPRAHAAAVSDVTFMDDRKGPPDNGLPSFVVGTASNDQMVKLWEIEIGLQGEGDNAKAADHGLRIRRRSRHSAVADAACLSSVGDWVVVAGVGMESLPKNSWS